MVGERLYQIFVIQSVCHIWGGREFSRPYHGNQLQRYKKMAEARCGASACGYYFLALCVWIAKPCYKYI